MSQGRATFTMQFDHYAEAPANVSRRSSGEVRLIVSTTTVEDSNGECDGQREV